LSRYGDGFITFIREVAHGAFPEAQAARARGRCFFNISVTWLWCDATTPRVCYWRQLDFKPRILDLAGSRALNILPLTCTANNEAWLGSTARVSLHLAALL
jgi:hypothetical protein